MSRGQPDFGLYAPKTIGAGISDLGELAARIGSIITFDRRGDVYWFDDFEGAILKWQALIVVPGEYPVLYSEQAGLGSQCVKFECPASALAHSVLKRNFSLVSTGKIGAEMWLQTSEVDNCRFGFQIRIYDGVNETTCSFRYDLGAKTIEVETPSGWIEVLTGITMSQLGMFFLPIKIVCDMDSDYYTRLIVGNDEVDISEYPLYYVGTTTSKYLLLYPFLSGSSDGASEAYIDNFILTVNEP